ncbi:MAG: hypothetical protein AAB441_04460 [Patescibacteria group bacterium]
MDPIQPPINIPDFQPKPNYLKTTIFSILIVITLGLIAYLIFQNQKLQKQVLIPPVSPTIQTPSPTSKPSSSISIPSDETAGWKTYTNTECFYSFGYPNSLKLVNIADGADGTLPNNAAMVSLEDNYEETLLNINCVGFLLDVTPKSDWNLTNVIVGDSQAKKFISIKPEVKFDIYHINTNNSKTAGLEILANKSQSTSSINQILSTFKFIDDRSVCVPTYQVETNSVELTAEQNYSVSCTEQRSEKDCFSIDLYNQKADDFSTPDGIPDCIWKNPINTI